VAKAFPGDHLDAAVLDDHAALAAHFVQELAGRGDPVRDAEEI